MASLSPLKEDPASQVFSHTLMQQCAAGSGVLCPNPVLKVTHMGRNWSQNLSLDISKSETFLGRQVPIILSKYITCGKANFQTKVIDVY